MRVLMRLQGDLFDIIQTVKGSEQEKLPLRAWWGGAFTVLAKQTFESLFIPVSVTNITNPPHWDLLQNANIIMTQEEFVDFITENAISHNETQFIWDVSKIEEENGVIKIQMGEFQWIDPMENEELDIPNER